MVIVYFWEQNSDFITSYVVAFTEPVTETMGPIY